MRDADPTRDPAARYAEAIRRWFEEPHLHFFRPHTARDRQQIRDGLVACLRCARTMGLLPRDPEANIAYWVRGIDKKLTAQLNEVMHHPDFQKLESTWRGLHYLAFQTETGPLLKIRVLDVTKHELSQDLGQAIEFDQSALFQKVHDEEYLRLGGEPYGLLVGDFEFTGDPEDIALLGQIALVAASAHAPFVAAVSPQMCGFRDWAALDRPRQSGGLDRIFAGAEYSAWRSFRESADSRYVALTLPRVLARLPYGVKGTRIDEFDFEEDVNGPTRDGYLWMSAAWAYATRVTAAFAAYGWLARTRGVEGGGRVEGLPAHTFLTDEGRAAMKGCTEVAVDEIREFELSNLGFLPLIHCKNRDYAAFMGAQSCQKPGRSSDPEARAQAELSSKLNYILCAARFSQCLRVMIHDRIAGFMTATEYEAWLNGWLADYVIPDRYLASDHEMACRPLAAGRVEVGAVPGRPGWLRLVLELIPNYQLECLTTSLRLAAEIPPH
jgi:type VI secretion system protein ImpC